MQEELKKTTKLTCPLAAAELAHISMGFTDAFLFSLLGVNALAGAGLGVTILHFMTIVSLGFVASVSNIVSVAYGAKDSEEINNTVKAGLLLSVVFFLIIVAAVSQVRPILLLLGQEDVLIAGAYTYMSVAVWSALPLLVFRVLRGLSAGIGHSSSILKISLLGTCMNLPLSYLLMEGGLGIPRLGVFGIGLATSIVALIMCVSFAVDIFRLPKFKRWRFWQHKSSFSDLRVSIKRVLNMGFPIGIAYGMESGLFTVAGILAGQLGAVALAAHQIAFQCTIVAFRIPAAIAQATSILVGQSFGANKLEKVKNHCLSGLLLGFVFSFAAASIFLVFPEYLVKLFTTQATLEEVAVKTTAISLLAIVAAFQLADSWQVIAMGALRGLHQAHLPTLLTIVGYWGVGLPAAYYLVSIQGITGLWWGLALGLAVTSVSLLVLLWRTYSKLRTFRSVRLT